MPDMMTSAKALGGGLPIGALICGPRYADVLEPGDHGSTFAGGPVVCAAAHAVLDVVEDPALLARVRALGERLAERPRASCPASPRSAAAGSCSPATSHGRRRARARAPRAARAAPRAQRDRPGDAAPAAAADDRRRRRRRRAATLRALLSEGSAALRNDRGPSEEGPRPLRDSLRRQQRCRAPPSRPCGRSGGCCRRR